MSAIAAHMVTRFLIVSTLVFASGCAAVSADSAGGVVGEPTAPRARDRSADLTRIQLRMNRHAEREAAIYR